MYDGQLLKALYLASHIVTTIKLCPWLDLTSFLVYFLYNVVLLYLIRAKPEGGWVFT